MAQPSVAREPSMEEILASIRRIIESNEPATADALSGHLPPVYDDEDAQDDDLSSSEALSPPAHVPPPANQGFGARQVPDFALYGERQEAGLQDGSDKTMSLADVAARVRAAADRNASLGPQAYAPRAPEPSAAQTEQLRPAQMQPAPAAMQQHGAYQPERAASAPAPSIGQRPSDVRPLMAAAASARPREMPTFNPPAERVEPAAVQQPPMPAPAWETMELRGAVSDDAPVARASEIRAPAPVMEPSVTTVAEPPQPVAKDVEAESHLSQTLVSAAAGAHIARSFGELADVFDGVNRPSVEELAQDMLRPMLQEWLEDNLPTLVERLVREEIERVARGPRR